MIKGCIVTHFYFWCSWNMFLFIRKIVMKMFYLKQIAMKYIRFVFGLTDQKTKRQKKIIYIVMSGQFRTLAMFFYCLQQIAMKYIGFLLADLVTIFILADLVTRWIPRITVKLPSPTFNFREYINRLLQWQIIHFFLKTHKFMNLRL